MKILEKITLIIYSNIMLVLSIILCLLIFGWLDIDVAGNVVRGMVSGGTITNIVLAVCVIFILLSIKCIFFDSTSKEQIKERQGVLLANDNGKLMISKEQLLLSHRTQSFQKPKWYSHREHRPQLHLRSYTCLLYTSRCV